MDVDIDLQEPMKKLMPPGTHIHADEKEHKHGGRANTGVSGVNQKIKNKYIELEERAAQLEQFAQKEKSLKWQKALQDFRIMFRSVSVRTHEQDRDKLYEILMKMNIGNNKGFVKEMADGLKYQQRRSQSQQSEAGR